MKKKLFRISIAGLAVSVVGGLAAALPAQAAPPAPAADPDLPVSISDYDVADSIALVQDSDLSARSKQSLTDLYEQLGDDGLDRIRGIQQDLGVDVDERDAELRAAIDPHDYDCRPGSSLSFWRIEQMARLSTPLAALVLSQLGLLDLTMVDAALTQGKRSAPFPEESAAATRTAFRKAQAFWEPPTDKVRLTAVDTTVWDDSAKERWIDAAGYVFGAPVETPAEREAFWDEQRPQIMGILAEEPVTRMGRAPLFASLMLPFDPVRDGEHDPLLQKDRALLVGHGYYRAMKAAGFTKVGIKAAVARRYAHFVQVGSGSLDEAGTPEAGRRNGLLSDAMAGYFLEHRKGLDVTTTQRRAALGQAPSFGDCTMTVPSHEGTPNQAVKAMRWGMNRPAGPVTATPAFAEAFDAALPRIIRPDAVRAGN